jgi:uncharacterized protein YndB with AHSA1/START domain
MKEFVVSRHVEATPQRVFALFTDFANAAQHVRAIENLELLTPGPVGKGTRFRETRTLYGRSHSEDMEVIEFEPGHSYTIGCDSCGARYRTRISISPEARGSFVRMHTTVEPLTLYAKLMGVLMAPLLRSMQKAIEQDLSDLRAVAEKKD